MVYLFGDLVARLSPPGLAVQGVIMNSAGEILLLHSSYDDEWGLPGGAAEKTETLHKALKRECREETGLDVEPKTLTGIYFLPRIHTQLAVFTCAVSDMSHITLSHEHSEYKFVPVSNLPPLQKIKAEDALDYSGKVVFKTLEA